MAEIINLREYRKKRARAAKKQRAGEKRVRFGRGKRARKRETEAAEKAARKHEGHKRQRREDGDQSA